MRKLVKLKFMLFCVLGLLMSVNAQSQAQLQCYDIVGYFPSWTGAASAIDYSKYTMIDYAFAIPGTNGNFGTVDNSAKLIDLVSRGHANNVKIILSVGGWLDSSPSNTPFETIANNSATITTFVNNCANLITQYNLDGIDLDWEYPTSKTKWNNVIVPLATKIHGMGKLLTAAVSESASNNGGNYDNVAVLDLVNIMCYGSYQLAHDAIIYWTGRGVPQNKRMLGVPFYSADNNTAEHVQKANFAKTNAGGIMIWDIATEYGDITSIYNTLGSVCGKTTTPTCNTVNLPGTLQAESYCSMSGIQTETTTDTGGGQNVGYVDTNDWMAYRINAASAGTYTVQYRVASLSGGGSIRLETLGGGTAYGTIAVPSTGGWQTWTTISQTITLAAGQRDIAIVAAAGGFNINWFSITGGTTSSNLALNKPVTVSSSESTTFSGSQAVDGNATTRWSSAFSDPQWIYVNLGATYNVNRVKITWEAAYGKNYTIESSADASTWTNLKTVTNNTALVNDNTGLSGNAHYIRINGTARATAYGYSIFELEVYGTYVSGRLPSEESIITENDNFMTGYPNPMGSTTTIAVNLPTTGHAVINVSGSLGNKITELHNGYLEAGKHEFIFNSENIPSGLYLYSVIFNGQRTTKKLIK